MKEPAVGKTAGPAASDKGEANHTRRADLPQVPPQACHRTRGRRAP